MCLGWKKVDGFSLTPPRQPLDTRGQAVVGARRSCLAGTPRVCLPRPAEPHPVAAYQPLRPCGSGQRTHPSPTTTHLMACMGAGPGGGGRGREPSCGEMPGAAAAADPNAERAAGDSRAPPSVGCEDSRVRAGGAGQGASCSGGGAPASPWTPKAQTEGPHPGTRTSHHVTQAGDATEIDAPGRPRPMLPGDTSPSCSREALVSTSRYDGSLPSCLIAIRATQLSFARLGQPVQKGTGGECITKYKSSVFPPCHWGVCSLPPLSRPVCDSGTRSSGRDPVRFVSPMLTVSCDELPWSGRCAAEY